MNTTKGHIDVRRRPKYIGTHLICELFDCKGDLNSERLAKKALVLAVKKLGAKLLYVKTHKFSPQGLTAFALLAESHISIHTWPEHNFMALDIFTCSKRMKPKEGLKVFKRLYKPSEVKVIDTERGANHRKILKGDWYSDKTVSRIEYLSTRLEGLIKIRKRLFKTNSKFQQIEVVDTYDLGRALILDGILQTTEKDEFIYHEMLVHPAMLATTGSPQNALIIGGGDGGSLREVLKYPSLQKIYLCEIDAKVVEVCKKFLGTINQGSFDHPKTQIIFEDGAEFIKKFSNFFDVVIVDSSDPFGPAEALFSEKFYRQAFRALKNNGVLSIQGGMSSPIETTTLKTIVTALKKIYPVIEIRLAYIPSYFGNMNFVLAAKKQPSRTWKFLPAKLRYHTPEINSASKVLPVYLRDKINGLK